MRFLKRVGAGVKSLAKGASKGISLIEKVASAADKASGGLLRTGLATATGGLSEAGLQAYKSNKGLIQKSLQSAEKVGRIGERIGETGKVAGSGAYTMAKQQLGSRSRDYVEQGERFLQQNPKFSQGLTSYSRGQIKPNFITN